MVTWVDVGGRCYKVVSEHGSSLLLHGLCVGHPCMSFMCVSLILALHVLVAFHNGYHGCSDVFMRNLMFLLWSVAS